MSLSQIDSSAADTRQLHLGFGCAIAAHVCWGLFPIYWRQLSSVASVELVWHRILWSFLLLSLIVPMMIRSGRMGGRQAFVDAVRDRKVWRTYAISAVLIAINWFAFLWAVNHNRVLEASLGYYINPLLNVVLGVVVLGERLGAIQWWAVAIAAVGVVVMSVAGGGVPWVSLAMAGSFSLYGLVKKRAPLPALLGLWMELTVLALPAMLVLGTKTVGGVSALNDSTLTIKALLVIGGLVTVTPLLLFAAAVRRVNLSTIGILQYIGPTLQFLVGAFLFGELLDQWRILGFGFVWTGLVVFLVGPVWIARQSRQQQQPCAAS